MRFMKSIPAWMAVGLLVFALACGGGGDAGEESGDGDAADGDDFVTVDPAKAATVTGKIKLDGDAPKMPAINMSAEPDCKGLHEGAPSAEVVVASDGMLQNVFVWVKSGLNGKFKPSTTTVHLDQKGCIYQPHVIGVQAGQKVNITNSDPTTHNVHPLPKTNREWNKSQTGGGASIEYAFPRPEIMIPVKCNIHPWMRSYISVVDSPFFAVSGADGSFEIKGLPAGTYTIEAVHERFGATETSVTVGDAESKDIEFTFSAS
jgi:plastocyanin